MTGPRFPFYLLRHGETVANNEGYAAGALDTPLTAQGRAQAEAARVRVEALAPAPVLIVHSALSRARDTARLVNQNRQLPMREVAALGERSFGTWVYRPWAEVAQRLAAGETPDEGESWPVFQTRVVAALTECLATLPAPLLIVTHGGVFDVVGAVWGIDGLAHAANCALCAVSL
jgi:probable phosphoglycerate mutase